MISREQLRLRLDIGDISIYPNRREVTQGGKIISVEPLVFDLIVFLIENSDRVISKDELIESLWAGRVISESTLSSCIKAARRTLGDTGKEQRIIKTFHRRGFRFVGSLQSVPATESVHSEQAETSIEKDDVGYTDTEGIDLSLPIRPSIAVLPFSTLDPHGGQQLLAAGLVHDLTVRLARTRWLFVTAKASAERFRIQTSDSVSIGQRLGVRYLLHGSVIRSVNRIRLTVTLSDTEQDREIWAEHFDRKIDDIFQVQDEICDQIVVAVESEIDLKERQKALLKPLASLDAWSAYHRANDLLYQFSPTAHDQAEHLLHHAARADPASSRIIAGLSFLHWQRAFFDATGNRDGEIARAIEYGQQSVSLDPYDPQAHWVLGRTALLTAELDLAVDELSAAVDLNPNFSKGHFSLGYGKLFRMGTTDAVQSATKARRLSPYDPMSFAYLSLFAEAHSFSGNHAEAMLWAKRAARQPHAHFHIVAIAAWCHEAAGDHKAALGFATEVRRRRPNYTRAEFFQAYPYADEQRSIIDTAFQALGF